MVMPPDHVFKHEMGVANHYHRIADDVDTGSVPYIRGFDVTARLLKRIAAHENVVGVKWTLYDVELFMECVACAEDVVWMCGMAEPPAPAYYLEGVEGFSAGVTNFEPRVGPALFDALDVGEYERARRLRDLSHPLMAPRAKTGEENSYAGANSVPVVKQGISLAGRYGGPVRDPLVELPAVDREWARKSYEELQDDLDELDVPEYRS